MEENQKSAFMPSLINGIYLGLTLVVFSLLMFLLDVDRESWINYISYIIIAAGLYMSIVNYRDKQSGGFIEYGKAFGSGFYTGLFASIITGIFTFIYVQYIDTVLIEEILVKAEESILESNPEMSDEQLNQALSITRAMFASPLMMAIWGFFFNLIAATLLSLIIAIFAKRENQQVA